MLLEEGVCYDQCVFSWQNSVSLRSASFCTPMPIFPVIPGISYLPSFACQSLMVKRTSFFLVLVLEGLVGLQIQFLWHYWLGHILELL